MRIKTKSPLHWIYYRLKNNRNYWKTLKDQLKTQYLTREQLKKIQFSKFKRLIDYAYNNVEFHRRKLDSAGVLPSDIKNLNDIELIPITTKEELRNNFPNSVVPKNISKYRFVLDKTSGSTNQPFEFYKDKDDGLQESCSRIKWLINSGYKLGEKRVLIRGTATKDSNFDSFFSRVKFISCFGMNKNEFNEWCTIVRKQKPKTIESYPSALVSLSKYLKENSMTLNVPIVISMGEMLLPENRQLIERFLNCKVYDSYGCSEAMYIAQECKLHNGFHYDMSRFLIECVDKEGKNVKKGSAGDVLITNLDNYAMPFIRYKVGDRAVLSDEKCDCGMAFPKIKEIKGRIVDELTTPSGRVLDFAFFASLFEEKAEQINQYQIIQRKKDKILIKVVLTDKPNNKLLDEIKDTIAKYFDNEMSVEVIQEEDIPLGRTGKRVFIISEVK